VYDQVYIRISLCTSGGGVQKYQWSDRGIRQRSVLDCGLRRDDERRGI